MSNEREQNISIHGALVVRLVDRMMQFRYDRAKALIDGKYDKKNQDGPEHLSRFAEATALAAIVRANSSLADLPMDYDSSRGDDMGAFFRLYGLSAGHTLTHQDMIDLEAVLAEYNDEIGNQSDKWHAARQQAYRDLGGDELVQLMDAKDEKRSREAVEHAMAKVRADLAGATAR